MQGRLLEPLPTSNAFAGYAQTRHDVLALNLPLLRYGSLLSLRRLPQPPRLSTPSRGLSGMLYNLNTTTVW